MCGKSMKLFPSEKDRKYCSKKCFDSMPKGWLVDNKFRKGCAPWNKGNKGLCSEETIKKMSEAKEGKVRAGNPNNWKHTKEAKKKMSEDKKGCLPTAGSWKKGDNKGEENWNWKGGVSRAYKTGFYSIEYREWRKSVFERDGYVCQKCFKKRGQYITAHHIKSFAKYPELRFEIDNGLTLCEKCHEETDNYKGRANK